MRGKIILEEHVAMPEDRPAETMKLLCRDSNDLATALLDIDLRLQEMNDNGVEMTILSQNGPGPQGIRDPEAAEAYAVRSNDYIAQMANRAPERLAAFATVSMHDVKNAVAELTRCVEHLGMVGVMINDAQEYVDPHGAVAEHFYDDAKYDVFWATVQRLDVPVYLHPKPPRPAQLQYLYKTRPWLIGPTYSFAVDCGFHALALCTSGLFDRFPRVRLILGHMGETILGMLARTEHWLEKRDRGRHLPARRPLREYMETNIFITTAGFFSTPMLYYAMAEIGEDRIMFSVDSPYENITEGATWLDGLPLSQNSITKIGRTNAMALFPQLKSRMRTTEVEKLQSDRKRVIYTSNLGFDPRKKA